MMFIRHSLYLIFLTFGASSLLALPTLNPWEYALTNRTSNLPILENHPDLSFRLGFLGDYVLNRKLETSENQTNSDIQKTTLKTHQGLLSLTINKRLDFYAGLGASSLTLKTPASSFNYHFSGTLSVVVVPFPAPLATYSGNNIPTFDPNSPLSLITNPSFSYTLGLSSILWKGKNLAISAAGSYFYTNPNVASVFLPFSIQNNLIFNDGEGDYAPQVASTTVYPNHVTCNYQEWQAAVSAAYIFRLARTLKAIPFVSLECSGVNVDFKNAVIQTTSNLAPAIQGISPNLLFSASPLVATLYDLQQQTWLGCTFGTSFVGNNCFAASIEWRFANENAFCIDFNVNF